MNKKAFLLAEETLKIVIAVISISFLVYFLSSLYFANQSSKELELAEATLERIGDIIKDLSEGNLELQDISNPQGWYLFSFTENEKPNTCIGKSCLCICDEVLIDNGFFGLISGRQAEECNEKGVCLAVPELKKFNEIEIKNPNDGLTKISIEKQNNEILIQEK